MIRDKIYPRDVKFYPDNVRVSVTNSMSLQCSAGEISQFDARDGLLILESVPNS